MDVEFLPDMGRPAGRLPPLSIDHLHPERDEILEVSLFVTRSTLQPYNSYNNHWTLIWCLGTRGNNIVHRKVHIVREIGFDHLTNWGGLTKLTSPMTVARAVDIPLKKMDLEQRRRLEKISERTEVVKPNGKWNCQDWIVSVLESAEAEGLVSREEWTKTVEQARNVTTE
jgi:hypothetical protein